MNLLKVHSFTIWIDHQQVVRCSKQFLANIDKHSGNTKCCFQLDASNLLKNKNKGIVIQMSTFCLLVRCPDAQSYNYSYNS